MRVKTIIIFIIVLSISAVSFASNTDRNHLTIRGRVIDGGNGANLSGASVVLCWENRFRSSITDERGEFLFNGLKSGKYEIIISFIGYQKRKFSVSLYRDTVLNISLNEEQIKLAEVVVTASESKGITSSSIINRQAMQHLQPSSFSDLLELLPGGRSTSPALTISNFMRIREVGIAESKYSNSLGVSFVFDGIPVSTDANMQYTLAWDRSSNKRDITNRGVDMRSISTDQIEKVEIIRGIPSVRYGDLTSGVVDIVRKQGASPLEARFKADGLSKLFYIGKGFELKNSGLIINIGLDFLNAKANPVNNFENYKRLTSSLRATKLWNFNHQSIRWKGSVDFSNSIDNERTDPENGYAPIDSYKSRYRGIALVNKLDWNFSNNSLLSRIEFKSSLSLHSDKIKRTKFIQLLSPSAIPTGDETGERDGIYLPGSWVSDLEVDGKPLSLFLQCTASFVPRVWNTVHNILTGVEYSYDKNFGNGHVYDPTRPPSPDLSTRARPFWQIPAGIKLSCFVEDNIFIPIRGNQLKLTMGVRGFKLLNMEHSYKMSHNFYLDPRLNLQWQFPSFDLFGKNTELALSSGIGWHSKSPTLDQLYPDYFYEDIVQLNYYHNNPEYRRINLMTYKDKIVNYNIEPAKNRKWEIRLFVSYGKSNLSLTYFKEEMTNSFRSGTQAVRVLPYKRYDINSINYADLNSKPDLNQITYSKDTLLAAYSAIVNGSQIKKEGIEMSLSSARSELLKTRISFNGAWFRSIYTNTVPIYRGSHKIINDKMLKEIGIYNSEGGYIREKLNTNLILDTHIAKFGLTISTSIQCAWFFIKQSIPYIGTPYSYLDISGKEHPYTEKERSDYRLQWLDRKINIQHFRVERIPFEMNVNFKASKNFKDKMVISLFVNGMLTYYPDYKVNDAIIKRKSDPYFGMELNIMLN